MGGRGHCGGARSTCGDRLVSPFCINGQQLLVISFPAETVRDMSALSPAEKHVAQLILQGHSNTQIAAIRHTALRTTANQVASIFRKYGVNSRAELATVLLIRIA
jgi:DNA-binding CsgD family transcriptional regulator